MNGHKFISSDVTEYFIGDAFVETATGECYVCGAMFEKIRFNYSGSFTHEENMSVCSGNPSAHLVENIKEPNCTCILCDA